jgi:D-cysteine desulfhydrase
MKIPSKINLANLPTPIQEVQFNGKKIFIKRDDFTGTELSGNKVRKLEYILAQAKRERADIIFTCGGDQSNHARATAIAAAKLGMKCRLFLWGTDKKNPDGNLFLDKLTGCEIRFLNQREYSNVNDIMFEERKRLLKKGKNAFVIPEGGSTTLGIWGYISFMQELSKQVDLKTIDGILTASGSGGTSAGLLLGSSLLNLKLKIYAVNVLYSSKIIKQKILTLAEAGNLDYKLNAKIRTVNLVILDGYSKEGYKHISPQKIQLIKSFFNQTGILLDPAYTGKTFAAYYENFFNQKNVKVLFVHTGGLFGVFGRKRDYLF